MFLRGSVSHLLCLMLLWFTVAPWTARAGAPSDADRVLGDWNGALEAGGQKLRIAFHFTRRADGGLAGTMDSPDQGALGLALDSVSVSGDTLRLALKRAGGSYQGVIAADATSLRGTWAQGGFTMPLDFGRGAAPERRRPQDPVKPYPYDEEEVLIESAAAQVILAGTLTKPHGAGPFPAVALITGSGPQNRDEELLRHRPFLVLADHLTRAGLAVLRCDDRGTAKSTGDFAAATTADFAGDARAEVEYLRARRDVDRTRIGLIGHSEGGLIAPLLAAGRKDVAFVVLMAGPGVPGDSLLLLQGAALTKAAGEPDSFVVWNRRLQRRLFAAVKVEQDTSALKQRLREIITHGMDEPPGARLRSLGPVFVESQIAMMATPWFRWFVANDPRPALSKLKCPVLAVTGGNDLQVPPQENLPAIGAALRAGRNRDFETVELPGLNHLFQSSTTGLPAEYGTIEETIAPAALDTVTKWIEARVGRKR